MRADDGTEVDDAPSVGPEPLDSLLHRENRPENVDVVVEMKALFGDFHEGAETEYSCVVDQNVQSSEGGIHLVEQSCDICGPGHVGPDRNRLTPAVGDRMSNAFGSFPVGGIVHGHASARSSQG